MSTEFPETLAEELGSYAKSLTELAMSIQAKDVDAADLQEQQCRDQALSLINTALSSLNNADLESIDNGGVISLVLLVDAANSAARNYLGIGGSIPVTYGVGDGSQGEEGPAQERNSTE